MHCCWNVHRAGIETHLGTPAVEQIAQAPCIRCRGLKTHALPNTHIFDFMQPFAFELTGAELSHDAEVGRAGAGCIVPVGLSMSPTPLRRHAVAEGGGGEGGEGGEEEEVAVSSSHRTRL